MEIYPCHKTGLSSIKTAEPQKLEGGGLERVKSLLSDNAVAI